EGRFRKDLFYRLNVLNIALPPLRERQGDIELLCEHILEKVGVQNASLCRELSPDALALLLSHAWPGNVRELRNVLEQAVMNTDEHLLEASDFHGLLKHGPHAPARQPQAATYAEAMAQAEWLVLDSALKACHGKVVDAARRLGIGRATFYKRRTALKGLSSNRDLSPNRDAN
ncbi:MAG: AAA family ATPase, partial [Holophaga sp.]|nr:AAA family ATPase [Holophaga sp.]